MADGRGWREAIPGLVTGWDKTGLYFQPRHGFLAGCAETGQVSPFVSSRAGSALHALALHRMGVALSLVSITHAIQMTYGRWNLKVENSSS